MPVKKRTCIACGSRPSITLEEFIPLCNHCTQPTQPHERSFIVGDRVVIGLTDCPTDPTVYTVHSHADGIVELERPGFMPLPDCLLVKLSGKAKRADKKNAAAAAPIPIPATANA